MIQKRKERGVPEMEALLRPKSKHKHKRGPRKRLFSVLAFYPTD
jgi:hypothetical protein